MTLNQVAQTAKELLAYYRDKGYTDKQIVELFETAIATNQGMLSNYDRSRFLDGRITIEDIQNKISVSTAIIFALTKKTK